MKKILVPTDFSLPASFALDVAASIARKSGAEVHLQHVIEAPDLPELNTLSSFAAPDSESAIDNIDTQLRELVEAEQYSDINATYSIDFSSPDEKITGKAREESFDLIVIGTRKRSALDKLLLGSVTEKVIRDAHCPVLNVRERISLFCPSNMLFSSSVTTGKDGGFRTVTEFAALYNAALHLVSINTKTHFETSRQSKHRMETFAKAHELSHYTINCYSAESEEEGIMQFAEEINADLICVPIHERTGLAGLFRQPVAETISERAYTPVLTFRMTPF